MIYLLYFVHVSISLFLILVVLLQQGKGADLSVFGGGASQAAFGARGAATLLHKLTVICFVLFMVTTISIGVVQSFGSSSVMGGVAAGLPEGEGADAATTGEAEGEDAAAPTDEVPTDATPAEADADGSGDDGSADDSGASQ